MDDMDTKSLTIFEMLSETLEFVQSKCISLEAHNSFWNPRLPFHLPE
jgi:hypothetical protein